MPELIKQGYVYLAQPPLFKLEKNKKVWYAYNDEELDKILSEVGRDQNFLSLHHGFYQKYYLPFILLTFIYQDF